MPTQATIVLDSGVLFPKAGSHCEIGYFQCEDSCSDITISIDGEEVEDLIEPFKLGSGKIEVRHLNHDGSPKQGGVKCSKAFHKRLLHLRVLYGGVDQDIAQDRFDCVIRFDSGHFCASMLKKRSFKEHKKQDDGSYKHDSTAATQESDAIAHNLLVHYTLKSGEALELARDNVVFWSSKNYGIKERLDIEIVADNSTSEKFFRHSLSGTKKDSYWLPNQGDPPPVCPRPPCLE